MRRASAAALRSGRAPWETPKLPEAPPWLQEVAVSPMSTATRSTGTSSSSATTWAIATSRLWPMSILPKNADTLPSGSTAIHESSSPGTSGGLPPDPAGPAPGVWASTSSRRPGTDAQATRAPASRRGSRGAREGFRAAPSRGRRLRALDRAQDGDVGAAAALEPGQGLPQLGVGGLRLLLQDGGGGHDPAVDAVAALGHLLLDVRPLERMGLLGGAEPLDGRHRLALGDRQRQDAR